MGSSECGVRYPRKRRVASMHPRGYLVWPAVASTPFPSPFPTLDIPKCNLLDYLFPQGAVPSDTPIWIDSKDTDQHLTPRSLLQWSKRLALGLDRIGSKPGEVVMIFTPNHIFVPVAYLGIVGSKRIFSGANPAYTVSGKMILKVQQALC